MFSAWPGATPKWGHPSPKTRVEPVDYAHRSEEVPPTWRAPSGSAIASLDRAVANERHLVGADRGLREPDLVERAVEAPERECVERDRHGRGQRAFGAGAVDPQPQARLRERDQEVVPRTGGDRGGGDLRTVDRDREPHG